MRKSYHVNKIKIRIRSRNEYKRRYKSLLKRKIALGYRVGAGRRSVRVHREGDQRITLIAPSCLDISKDFQSFAGFLESIRYNAYKASRQFTIDFRPIRELDPAAALMLAAEIDRWRTVRGVTLRTFHLEEWDPTVRSLLKGLGFFDLLGVVPPSDNLDTNESVKMLKFSSGSISDGSLAKQMRTQMEEIAGNITAHNFLYEGITEAMTNVCHHAYKGKTRYPVATKKWWMSGAFDSEKNTMRFMVFDQGVGIPGSLPRSTLWEKCRGLMQKWRLSAHDDASMIRAAMVASRTSTGLANRGQGLNNIMQFIDSSREGRLRILSRRGEVLYHHTGRVRQIGHSGAIGGTLIEWEVSR